MSQEAPTPLVMDLGLLKLLEPGAAGPVMDTNYILTSIAISLKRLADQGDEVSAWGDRGLGGVAQAIREVAQNR